MSILSRFNRLFQADLHALLDCMEEPESLLKQSLREMQESLQVSEKSIKLLENEKMRYMSRLHQTEATLESTATELDLCFSIDNEELIKRLLKRKIEMEKIQKTLNKKLAELSELLSEQKSQLQENKTLYEGMQQKLELYVKTDVSRDANNIGGQCHYGGANYENFVSDDEVELALLQEKKTRGILDNHSSQSDSPVNIDLPFQKETKKQHSGPSSEGENNGR